MAERARLVEDVQDRLVWQRLKALYGTRQTVLVDGPAVDPAFPYEGRLAGQAPEIDGVVLLRDPKLSPGRFAEVSIVEADGYELVGE
jgi:tRNA A37 methylthiotransferase MiaB